VGATEDTFAAHLLAAGTAFQRGVSQPWLTNKGHQADYVATRLDEETVATLRAIYKCLGGDETLLAGKRSGSNPRIDFLLSDQALAVEVDEIQHWTSDRLRTLDLYPPHAPVLFDVEEYRELIGSWSATADRYRAAKPTVDFPFPGGRRAQRAFFDAFRDLAAPSFGLRVLRVPAPECNGALAFERFRALAATIS
jgi:hypothetical protein